MFRVPTRVSFRGRTFSSRLIAAVATIALVGAGTVSANAAASGPRIKSVLLDDLVVVSVKEFPASSSLSMKATVTGGSGQATLTTNAKGAALVGFTLPDGFSGLVSLAATSGATSATTSISIPAAGTSTTEGPTSTPSTSSAPTSSMPAPTTTVLGPTTTVKAPTTTTEKPVGPTTTKAPTASGVMFEDDFNGAANALPDSSKWMDYSACTTGPPAAFGYIRCGADETLDGSGHLVLPATPKYGTALQTKDKFSFEYGTVSAWIKLPKQVGYWPAFWMLNDSHPSTTYLGEIDMMEAYTTWPDTSHAGAQSWNAPVAGGHIGADDNFCKAAGDLTTGFHKYSARVEPKAITFFVDDKQCGSTVTPSRINPWAWAPDNPKKNWIILDLALGGAGGAQKPAVENAQMIVDRVEVRSL